METLVKITLTFGTVGFTRFLVQWKINNYSQITEEFTPGVDPH